MQPGHPDRVGRLGAAVGEEDHVEVTGCQLGDQPRRLARGGVGVDRRHRAEQLGLLLDGGDELGVLMTDVDVDELAGEVQVTVPVLVPEAGALRAGDDNGRQRGRADQEWNTCARC